MRLHGRVRVRIMQSCTRYIHLLIVSFCSLSLVQCIFDDIGMPLLLKLSSNSGCVPPCAAARYPDGECYTNDLDCCDPVHDCDEGFCHIRQFFPHHGKYLRSLIPPVGSIQQTSYYLYLVSCTPHSLLTFAGNQTTACPACVSCYSGVAVKYFS